MKDAHFSLLGETPVFAHASSDLSLVGVVSGKGDPEDMAIFRERVPSLARLIHHLIQFDVSRRNTLMSSFKLALYYHLAPFRNTRVYFHVLM